MAAKKIVRMTQSNQFPVGTIIQSRLSELNFQEIMGPSWVLYDDRDVSGSELDNLESLPGGLLEDARGIILRGKNNTRSDGFGNPSGDLALGTFQENQNGDHNHGSGNHGHNEARLIPSRVGGDGAIDATSGTASVNDAGYLGNPILSSGTIISNQGGNETRMRNLTLNTFIKINP